jgi:hypothetical protein
MRQFYMVYSERVPRIGQTTAGQFQPFLIPQSLAANSGLRTVGQTLSGQLKSPGDSLHHPFSLSWSRYVFLTGIKEEELCLGPLRVWSIPLTISAHLPFGWR